MCPAVSAFPGELSVAPPVLRSAVLPPQWSLMQEPRPPRPVVPLSTLRHRRWPEEVLPAAVLPVAPERRAVAALVQVVPEQVAQVRAGPVQTQVPSVAVPRRPVQRVAEPPPEAARQAALRQVPEVAPRLVVAARLVVAPLLVVALPLVEVPRLVVARPLAAVAPSRAARLPVLRWWTQPVCRRELRWWTLRWSDR